MEAEGHPIHLKVLLSAYACMPNAGSEPGNGWNWAIHLAARGMHVTVLTRADNRPGIEAFLAQQPVANLEFAYVCVPGNIARPTSGFHYALWQWRAVRAAKDLHRNRPFQIVHHITYTSIHVPTQLWRLGVPTVFGPVGGGQTSPPQMLPYFASAQRAEKLRTLVTHALRHSPFHRYWLSKMKVIFAANSDTLALIKSLGRADVRLQFDNGISVDYLREEPRTFTAGQRPTRLLWVGRMLPRKALPMALDALKQCRADVALTIVGNGLDVPVVEKMISDRGLVTRVQWSGRRLTMEEVRAAYIEHDALLFTSVRETSGVQLLEAMALGLPIICLDLHGAHDLVPEDAGFKVPIGAPAEVIRSLAQAIERFTAMSLQQKNNMAFASWQFASKHTWAARAEEAERLYVNIIAQPTRPYPQVHAPELHEQSA